MHTDHLPALLFRQVCLLAWMTGLFAAHHPVPALCAFALLVVGDWPRASTPPRLALLVACLAAGLILARAALPVPASMPSWVTTKTQRIIATVDDVDGLPDGRLRILLREVRPLPDSVEDASLGGTGAQEPSGPFRNTASAPPSDRPAPGTEPLATQPPGAAPSGITPSGITPGSPVPSDATSPDILPPGTRRSETVPAPPSQDGPPVASLPGRLVWTWEDPTLRPLPGQHVTATLAVKPVRGFANPGGHDSAAYWLRRDVHFRAWTKGDMAQASLSGTPSRPAALREWLRNRLVDTLGGAEGISRSGGILLAILFGDRFHLDSRLLDLFARTDLLHSLALSGQHLAVAGLFAGALVLLAGRMVPQVFLVLPRRKLFLLFSLPPAAAYLWLGNAPPSLVRAALMLLFWTMLALANRPGILLDGLLWAVGCILLLDPTAVHDLGLQLSALAVAAIALSLPFAAWLPLRPGMSGHHGHAGHARHEGHEGSSGNHAKAGSPHGATFRRTLDDMGRRVLKGLMLLALTSLAVQVALLPVQLLGFGRASPWFVLNLAWLPFADLMVLPLGALGLLCEVTDLTRPLSAPLLTLAALPCEGLTGLLLHMESSGWLSIPALLRPHWTSVLGYGAIVVALASLPGRGPATSPRGKAPYPAMSSTPATPATLGNDGGQHEMAAAATLAGRASPPALAEPRGLQRSTPDSRCGQYASPGPQSGQALREERFPSASEAQRLFSTLPPVARRLLPLGLALLLTGPLLRLHESTSDTVTIDILDVGQGQAIALSLPDDRRLLVDGGGFNSPRFDAGRDIVAPALTANAAPRLDLVVNTHPDTDHLRGLIFIIDRFDVGGFLTNGDAPRGTNARSLSKALNRTGLTADTIHAGMALPLGEGLTLRVLHPPAGHRGSSNNRALVLRLEHEGRGLAVLCGDAEAPALRDILRSGIPLEAEVLVLPHHGSASSLLPAFYDAVAPKVAIASCGADNRFGFPSTPVREALAERGITLLTTADAGRIALAWGDRGRGSLRVDMARADEGDILNGE